jgi:tryptophan synthase alpha chain
VVVALAEAGADVVELGIPFSDPLADGPTIQASSQRALDAGMTPPQVLEIVRAARARTDVPIVLMGAWNPVLQYGIERFVGDAVAAGVDGTILTDLTPEEAGPWKRASDAGGLDTIFLLAPTSTPPRMDLVGKMATGFVYCVSRTGVTGARGDVPEDLPPLGPGDPRPHRAAGLRRVRHLAPGKRRRRLPPRRRRRRRQRSG